MAAWSGTKKQVSHYNAVVTVKSAATIVDNKKECHNPQKMRRIFHRRIFVVKITFLCVNCIEKFEKPFKNLLKRYMEFLYAKSYNVNAEVKRRKST